MKWWNTGYFCGCWNIQNIDIIGLLDGNLDGSVSSFSSELNVSNFIYGHLIIKSNVHLLWQALYARSICTV